MYLKMYLLQFSIQDHLDLNCLQYLSIAVIPNACTNEVLKIPIKMKSPFSCGSLIFSIFSMTTVIITRKIKNKTSKQNTQENNQYSSILVTRAQV